MSRDDHQAFRQAILDSPDDDAPSLIYADWLEEHGDADRAEFIRVQCALADSSDKLTDAARIALEVREYQLMVLHNQRWRDELPNIAGVDWLNFRQGGMSQVNLSKNAFGSPGSTLKRVLECAPVRSLRICCSDLSFSAASLLVQEPSLQCIKELHLYEVDNPNYLAVRALLNSRYWTGLRLLHCYFPYRGDQTQDLERWLDELPMPRLRSLSIAGRHFEPSTEFLGRMMRSQRMETLTGLKISQVALRWPDIAAIAESPRISGLKWLDLSGTNCDDHSAKLLAFSPNLRSLRHLNLSMCRIGDEGARSLAAPDNELRSLKSLNVSETVLGEDALSRLMARPGLERLDARNPLYLREFPVGMEECDRPGDLKRLNVANARWNARTFESLIRHPFLNSIVDLNLSQTICDPEIAKALASSPRMANLVRLNLAGWNLGSAFANKWIMELIGQCNSLQWLDLRALQFDRKTQSKLRSHFANGLVLLHQGMLETWEINALT